MAENIIGQDLVTLFRGEPTPFSNLGRTENNMLKGRFFSPDSELARGFAQRPGGVIRSMDVTPTQLSDTMKFKSGLKYKKGFDSPSSIAEQVTESLHNVHTTPYNVVIRAIAIPAPKAAGSAILFNKITSPTRVPIIPNAGANEAIVSKTSTVTLFLSCIDSI